MTAQQGGGEYRKRTVYPRISTTVSLANKETAVLYAEELRKLFVPDDISPSITITKLDESEGCSVFRVTIDSSVT